jgi:hypothetical protein
VCKFCFGFGGCVNSVAEVFPTEVEFENHAIAPGEFETVVELSAEGMTVMVGWFP